MNYFWIPAKYHDNFLMNSVAPSLRIVIGVFFIVISYQLSLFCQITDHPDIEFVESIPIETTIDNADIRNTGEVWLEMINNATQTLDIEEFYISNKAKEPLEDILSAIITAAKRGVSVRIIVDSRMYKTYPESVDMLSQQKNISTRIINWGQIRGGIQHAKFFIVDSKDVFVGSQNFDWRAIKHIFELGLRIKHKEMVKFYKDIFELDWNLALKNEKVNSETAILKKKYDIPFLIVNQLNDTLMLFPTASPIGLIPDSSLWDEKYIVDLIGRAKKVVLLQFLSYSPVSRDKTFYAVLDNALRNAAARGVEIKMLISDWEKDHPAVDHLKSLALVPNIDIKLHVIPEWSGGYISFARVDHRKYICVDSTMFWLGTSNGEKSYFYTSRNVGVVVKNRTLGTKLHDIFMKSWNGPYSEIVDPAIEYQPRFHGEK